MGQQFCKQYTENVQFVLHGIRNPIELLIEIIFLLI